MEEKNGKNTVSGSAFNEFWNKGGFVLCTGGHADIRINEKMYRLSRGSVFVVTPLVRFSDFTPSPDYERIKFLNDLKIFYPIFRLIAETGLPLKVKDNPCWEISGKEISYIIDQDRRISENRRLAIKTQSQDERTVLTHLVNLICHETMLEIVYNPLRRFPASIDTVGNHSALAYRFILLLHENYKTERSVSWYASQANMSTGHFSSLIREATGQTPSDWISTVTTSYAKLMLEQTEMSIKEIAHELNFPEQFTFRKYFKRNTGMAPTEYRNLSK